MTRTARTLVDIASLARVHSPTAIRTLAGIMRQKTAPASARVAACGVILDRAYGKAAQNHELTAEIQITVRKLFESEIQPQVIDVIQNDITDNTNDDKPKIADNTNADNPKKVKR